MIETDPDSKQYCLTACIKSVPVPLRTAIVLATLIRIALVFQGQYVFPDEDRYDRALDFWAAVSEFEPARAVTVVFKARGRPGAIVSYLPPALVQWGTNRTFGTEPIQTSWIPALFTVLLAAVNTLLLWRLGVKLFGRGAASTLAAILYGFLAPGLYYAQFLLPYVVAQTYLLGCLVVLPGREEGKRVANRLLISGVLFGCGLATYPGLYDQAIVLAIVAVVLIGSFEIRKLIRLLWVPVGGGVTLVLWELFSWLGWGPHYFESLRALKVTIVQGDFGEVWRMPVAFLWTADPLLSVVLLVGLLAALARVCFAFRDSKTLVWLLAAILLWYGFRASLGVLEREVLYGRLVFQIVPMLCLVAGAGWLYVLRNWAENSRGLAGVAVVAALWAGWNVRPFFQVAVPEHFEWRALHDNPEYDVIAYVSSIEGTGMMSPDFDELDKRLVGLHDGRPGASTPVVLANTRAIFPVGGFREPPGLDIIAEARHPLNIPALQYEAWNPSERAVLSAQPLSVMLLRPPPEPELHAWLEQWGGYKKLELETP